MGVLVCIGPTLLVVCTLYHAYPMPTCIYPNCLTPDFSGPVVLVFLMCACSLCCWVWLPCYMQLASTVGAAPTYPTLLSYLHVLLAIPPYCTGWLVLLYITLTLSWAFLVLVSQ